MLIYVVNININIAISHVITRNPENGIDLIWILRKNCFNRSFFFTLDNASKTHLKTMSTQFKTQKKGTCIMPIVSTAIPSSPFLQHSVSTQKLFQITIISRPTFVHILYEFQESTRS